MQSGLDPETLSTEEKLLRAALEVFSREGIGKATTREIAKVAGVNEVTLFRKFQNKQGLLAGVLEQTFLPAGNTGGEGPSIEKGDGLEKVLLHFATADFERKRRHAPLMRVLVAESHRLGGHEAEILRRIFLPWKQELGNQLSEARRRGLMREGYTPAILVDQLVAMLFVGALRCEGQKMTDYTAETYLRECVGLILAAVSPLP